MKDIYELLNNIDINQNEFEELSVSETDKENFKNNIIKSINKKRIPVKKKIAAAAAFAIICTSSVTVLSINPALASNIPIISDLFHKELVNTNKQYADYEVLIGKTSSCNGIDVTFESAVADNTMLFLNYTVKNYSEKISNNSSDFYFTNLQMKVNGENIYAGGSASCEFIDNNTVHVIKKIPWSKDMTAINKMNIELNVSDIYGRPGTWSAKFFLDKSNQISKTYEAKINTPIEVAGVKGEITSAKISPLTVQIKGRGDFNKDNDPFFAFIILDDKGNVLDLENGGGDAKSWESNFISNNNMKSITIIPTYSTRNTENTGKLPSVKLDINKVHPILLKNNEDSCLNITNYFMDGDYLIVKFHTQYFGKGTSGNSWFSEPLYVTADGKEINEYDEKSGLLWRKYYNHNDNVQIFKIGLSRDIMIGTYDGSNVKIMKDKSTTIKLKK